MPRLRLLDSSLFKMSLFIGLLAFPELAVAQVGVLLGSMLAALVGLVGFCAGMRSDALVLQLAGAPMPAHRNQIFGVTTN